jgi:hypothetical protein
MFWNEPHMYGANFPYREFMPTPTPAPFLGQFYPQQNIPRFMPNYYGFVPQLGYPTAPLDPFMQRALPQNVPWAGFRDPFAMNLPQNVPWAGFRDPFAMNLPQNVPWAGFRDPNQPQNIPFFNWFRPCNY